MTEYIERRELPQATFSPVTPLARPSDMVSRMLSALHLWHQRARQRRQLGLLDDRLLRDIGIDRASAREETAKPFWLP